MIFNLSLVKVLFLKANIVPFFAKASPILKLFNSVINACDGKILASIQRLSF